MNYIASLYAAIPAPSGFQLMIFGVLCALSGIIYLAYVLPDRPPHVVTRATLDARIKAIVQESQPMPLEPAYLRGVQAGARRHVRAGSIE